MEQANTISVRGISKSFAGVKALNNVSIDIEAGKVHGLIGANGAGKSTLIKILAGVYQPDTGDIYINGQRVAITDPAVASANGLSFIHQELHLVQNFTVAENLTLGLKKQTRAGMIDWKKTAAQLQHVLEIVGFQKSVYTLAKDLSIAGQWLVAIAKALYQDVKFIAMDEPTAALSETEVRTLFSIIHDLTAHGIGVIYVSHRLDEVIALCDEVTVFKDGCKILHEETKNLTKENIITAIAGHKIEALESLDYCADREALLTVSGLEIKNKVHGISFQINRGEILGLTGLVGSGRTETALAIFGALKRVQGQFEFEGKAYAPKQPKDAVKNGIVIVPEDRRSEGLITNQTVAFNINLPALHLLRVLKHFPLISMAKHAGIAQEAVDVLNIKTSSVNEMVLNLSGGNQQNVVVGKWLKCHPKLIIMDEPTQGVDVGARAEIYKLIQTMAREENISFLIISSDIEELPGLCDRVLVMSEGRINGELVHRQIQKEAILHLCYAELKS